MNLVPSDTVPRSHGDLLRCLCQLFSMLLESDTILWTTTIVSKSNTLYFHSPILDTCQSLDGCRDGIHNWDMQYNLRTVGSSGYHAVGSKGT
jgi:hypothetical protein